MLVVWTTGTKQLRNTDFAGQVLKNASTCIVIKTKHPLACLCVTLLQQCDIIHNDKAHGAWGAANDTFLFHQLEEA